MNDPHVAALIYKIKHDQSVDYRKAKPMDHEEADFHVKIANEKVRFEFKKHHATVESARKSIEEYICAWEVDANLRGGANCFKLKFEDEQIEDRNPAPGVVRFSGGARTKTRTGGTLTLLPNCYPPPPSGLKITPDVQTMYDRYMGYRHDREPLPSMAYFCWTMIKDSPTTRRDFSSKVRNKISRLSSEKGGQHARKADGRAKELTAQESLFLEEAIKVIIRRVAERAHAPDSGLPKISLSDLPC